MTSNISSMANDTPDEKSVYLHCKDIINGEKAELSLEKTIISHLKKHRCFIKPLNDRFSTRKVAKVVDKLLRENVFDSPSVAKSRYPELFVGCGAQDLSAGGSETDDVVVEGVAASEVMLTPREDESDGLGFFNDWPETGRATTNDRGQGAGQPNTILTEYVYRLNYKVEA